MGRPYRTPSPAPEAYVSSSIVNSPVSTPAPALDFPDEYELYQQRRADRALEIAAKESGKRQAVNTSYLGTFFGPTSSHVLKDSTATLEKSAATTELTVEEPKTPTKKRVPNHWHGLPSPETPTFHGSTSEKPLAGSKGSQEEGSSVVTPHTPQAITDRDALLAHELEAELSPSTTRRSTRLRAVPKSNYALQPSIVPQRTVCKRPVAPQEEETSTHPEFSIVACKSDPIPLEGLPTVHSLSWQLQYPPGGSTHPSYPYPLMDPRLIFHQPFVPVVDGLPDITRVPKLVLPMGWNHVSWAGLLPIVFDPYRQAFKLTPVGPMPLTCEELRQGGLHKYVPGGELHPEFGMLPDMLKLSDGSDTEVFDFDGVDWTLPWEGHVNFHPSSASADEFQATIDGYPTPSSTSTSPTTIVTFPWKEDRDCPNMVVDLSDAWRWLAGKELNPATDFVPTPKKKWRGTGAVRKTHKFKDPIPELIMLALEIDPDSPTSQPDPNPIMQNQDTPSKGVKVCNVFCPFKSVATPVHVDITLLGDTEFTLVELLSYFPQHYNWGHAVERLAKAGLKGTAVKDLVNMTRALEGETALPANRVSNAMNTAKERDLPKAKEIDVDEVGKDTPAPTTKSEVIDMTITYTAEGWVYDVWDKIDYPLLALAHGLQAMPSVPDAGPLTALILWCRKEGHYQVLLSEVPALLKEAGIEPLIEAGEAGCPDKEVLTRHASAMKKDRRRVSASLEDKKRGLDDKEESKSKRRKTSE